VIARYLVTRVASAFTSQMNWTRNSERRVLAR